MSTGPARAGPGLLTKAPAVIQQVILGSGAEMSLRRAGSGPALVQVHGIGTGHHNFDLLTPHLAPRLSVYDVDLPGYGTSTEVTGERTIERLADAVAEFIETLPRIPVHVHGTSFGGLVAMALAANHPHLVDRLVLTCSFARLDNAMRAMQKSWQSAAMVGGEMLAEVTTIQGFSRGFWDRPDASSIQAAFVTAMASSTTDDFLRDLPLMAVADLSETATRVAQPTLLLGASEDQMTPVETAPSGVGMTGLAGLIPNASLEVIEGCGHFISIEQAEETAGSIIRFLERVEA
jgi:3-oxoadipate enol-lactonase